MSTLKDRLIADHCSREDILDVFVRAYAPPPPSCGDEERDKELEAIWTRVLGQLSTSKDWLRWRMVDVLHYELGLTWGQVFEVAARLLAATWQQGGVDTMRRAYKKTARTLPECWRRKKQRYPLG